MAEEVVAFVASTGTLPVGTGIVFDSLTIGGATGKAEMIKLLDGTAGSSTPIAASSAAIGAVGLQTFVTNSTGQPMGVSIAAGQSTVSVTGNVTVLFSTASTGSVIVANTTAAPANVQIVYNSSLVSTNTPFPVLLQGSTATVTIQGNTTATVTALTTASKIQVELSTTLGGFSSASPVYTVNHPFTLAANTTFTSTKITSTAAVTLFSSAASTRFNITDLVITNAGTVETVIAIYDGTTGGTKLFWTDLASAGGGVSIAFPVARRGTSGLAVTCETIPASTVYINVGAYRSA